MTQRKSLEKKIQLPEGFQIHPAQMGDLEEVTGLLNAYTRVIIGVEQYRLKDMRAEWDLPLTKIERDTCLVFAPDGRLAGYGEFWDQVAPYVRKAIWARVHPDFWDLGIDTVLVNWGVARSIQQAERAPREARVVAHTLIPALDVKSQGLLQGLGFSHVRTYWRMVRELESEPEAPLWPEGVTVRSLGRGEEHKAISAAYESFQDHWGFVPEPFENYLERWLYFINHEDEYEPELWFVAEDHGEIVGESLCFARAMEDPQMGWVSNFAVRRPWRKRGIGLALVQHSFREFYRRGSRRAGLGVDSQNLTGATRLYEKAGMHPDPVWTNLAYEKEVRPGVELSMRPEQE